MAAKKKIDGKTVVIKHAAVGPSITPELIEAIKTGSAVMLPPEPVVEIQYIEKVTEIVREVLVEKPVLEGFALYKKLKDERYPQGGMGEWWEDPNGTDKVYVPRPEEIYTHFLGNKQEWDELRDALVRVWIEYSLR